MRSLVILTTKLIREWITDYPEVAASNLEEDTLPSMAHTELRQKVRYT